MDFDWDLTTQCLLTGRILPAAIVYPDNGTAQLKLYFYKRVHEWCHEKSTMHPITWLCGPYFLVAWNTQV